MSEIFSALNPEFERERGLQALIEKYFPEDSEFLADMDGEDKLGYVYVQLLEQGEDPDEILREFGVTEVNDEV